MTDELVHAEARLEEASYALDAELARADELLEEIDATETPWSDEEVERFAEMCTTGAQATPQWRAVAERVARGEFSWRDVAEGRCDADQGVQAAIASMRPFAPEEASLREASYEVTPAAHRGPTRSQRHEFDEDEDYFSSGGFLR